MNSSIGNFINFHSKIGIPPEIKKILNNDVKSRSGIIGFILFTIIFNGIDERISAIATKTAPISRHIT